MQISGKGIPKSDISILNISNAHTRIFNYEDTVILSAPVSEAVPQCPDMP